jgi:hypothetical protein
MGGRERVDGKLRRHELGRIAGLGGVLQTQEPKRSRRARRGRHRLRTKAGHRQER